jgi:hypothetical protein
MDSRSTTERSTLILFYHDLPHQIHLKSSAIAKDQTSPRVPLEEQQEDGETTDLAPLLDPLSLPWIRFAIHPQVPCTVGEGD